METHTTIVLDDSSEEEQPVRRPARSSARAAKKRRASSQQKYKDKEYKEAKSGCQQEDNEEAQGTSCSICFDSISKEGPHMAATLACGHIFGKACIEKWLTGPGKGKGCPHCKKKAKPSSVIALYNLPTVVFGDATYTQDLELKCAQREKEAKEKEKEIERLRAQLAKEARDKEELLKRTARVAAAEEQQQHHAAQPQQHGPHHFVLYPPNQSCQQQGGAVQGQRYGESMHAATQGAWQSHAPNRISQTGYVQVPVQNGAVHHWSAQPYNTGMHTYGRPLIHSHKLNTFALSNCSCFDWAPADGLILAATCEGDAYGLRVLSMVNPVASRVVSLPQDVQQVRDLKIRSRDKMLAVATHGAGLLVLDRHSPQPVRRLVEKSTVHSCSWGAADTHGYQLLAGLDKGCVLLFDLRATSTQPLYTWQLPSLAPVHTVIPLLTPEAPADIVRVMAASSLGVWAMGFTAETGMQSPVCVLDRPSSGSTCSSLAQDAASRHFMASWRGMQNGLPAKHQQLQVAVAQDVQQWLSWPPPVQVQALEYCGHQQTLHRTRGTYIDWPGQASQMFASADEATCAPWVWSCETGQVVHRLDAHPSPVSQLLSGQRSGSTLLAACSHSRLDVHSMQLVR